MQVDKKYRKLNLTKIFCKNEEELSGKLKKKIHQIAHKEGFLTYRILSRTISTEGGNYFANLYEVDIKGKTEQETKETNIFIKQIISQENIKIVDVSEFYRKELFFYTDLSKIFSILENEAGVPHKEKYKVVKVYAESTADAIILQNLAKDGFSTVHRMDVMPLKFAELSIQQLAKFHALSFVLEKKDRQYFKRKITPLKQSVLSHNTFKEFCKTTYTTSTKWLGEDMKSKLDAKLPDFLDKYLKYLMGECSTSNVKCLCHGDYRMNNILFKITEGEITDVMPVDYQLIYYGSPVADLIYYIFGASDKEFRKNHLEDLKEMYFSTMEKYLKYFHIDIDTVYPRKYFEMDFIDNLDYGLLISIFLLPYLFALEGDVPDLDKDNILGIDLKIDIRFQDRLEGIIDDMIEWGKL